MGTSTYKEAMKPIILDLERSGTYSHRLKGYISEIIEFGAVKVDEALTVVDTFHAFVRPRVGRKISGKIRALTRLSDGDLVDDILFMQAVSRFREWTGDTLLMTWGTSDLLALIKNCRYFCGDGHIPFLTEYVDLQRYCKFRLPDIGMIQMGLSVCAQLLGIHKEESEHHRALNDSILSLECFRILYQKDAFESMIQDTDDPDFYPRLTFKTVILSDWEHPMVRGANMTILCDRCGLEAEQLSDWIVRNKSFRADFCCPHCDYRSTGHVQFKLKYDGPIVKKEDLPFQEESQGETAEGGEDMADLALDLQDIQEEF